MCLFSPKLVLLCNYVCLCMCMRACVCGVGVDLCARLCMCACLCLSVCDVCVCDMCARVCVCDFACVLMCDWRSMELLYLKDSLHFLSILTSFPISFWSWAETVQFHNTFVIRKDFATNNFLIFCFKTMFMFS